MQSIYLKGRPISQIGIGMNHGILGSYPLCLYLPVSESLPVVRGVQARGDPWLNICQWGRLEAQEIKFSSEFPAYYKVMGCPEGWKEKS